MKFAAIDFETANHRSDSPCQVAVVLVDEGKIVDEHTWLIRPRQLYFSDRCIAVHGIRPRDVLNQPEWDHVWKELLPIIDGRLLVAHNAMFDMAVLASTLSLYDLACPRIDFQCTRLIARRCWPGRSGYGLKPTAEALGIDFQHHIAVEDARACAKVALAAARDSQVENMEGLEQQLSIQRGYVEFGTRVGPRCIRRAKSNGSRGKTKQGKKTQEAARQQAKVILDGCAGIRPLENKRIFLTGSLLGMERSDSIAFLRDLGGAIDENLSPHTDFWILGAKTESNDATSNESHSTERDQTVGLPANPDCPTIIVHQRQLLAMIPGGLDTARNMALSL